MKMEYILIKKDINNKVKNKDENVIIIPSSPLMLIEKNFEKVNVNKISDENEEILRSNWDGTFFINGIEITFSIKQYSKQKLSYLSISTKAKGIYYMELVDEKINSIMANSYIVITSYDCISEFYCNKIYKKLNNFERKLKELIFDIYTFSYGMNYYERNFSEELKLKVKKLQDKSISSESKDIEQLKQSLYALDYNDIIELLFTPKWLVDDEKNKLILMDKIDKNNLSIKEIIDNIDEIRPKSDWDRLFLPQIGEVSNIEESINQLRGLRNRVAHCKFFRKNHYGECLKLLQILNRQVNKALKIVMNIDFQKLNAQYASEELHKSIELLRKCLNEMGKSVSEMMSNSIEQITARTIVPLTNIAKGILNSIKIPTFNYPVFHNRYIRIPIRSFKKFENKRYTKKRNKM